MVSGGLVFGVFLAVELVHKFDNDENSKSDDEEIDDILDEITVGDMSGSIGTEEIGDIDREGRKVKTAGEEASNRHNNIIDERFDDGSESATNSDTDGEINDATAIDKFLELINEVTVGDFLNWME